MTAQQIERIRSSFAALAPQGQALINRFYENLFGQYPQVRPMFPKDMTEQKKHLLAALALVVKSADKLETIVPALHEMGARHVKYGTLPEHYPIVREVLLGTMKQQAGRIWNQTLESDWADAINAVAGAMIEGAKALSRAA